MPVAARTTSSAPARPERYGRAAVLLVAAGLAASLPAPFAWAVGGLGVLALFALAPPEGACRRPGRALDGTLLLGVGALALLGLDAGALSELRILERPIGGDHALHFVRVVELARGLEGGALFGWGELRDLGGPRGPLYPILADLLVLGLHGLGAGLDRAYALTVLVAYLAGPLAVWGLGRCVAGRAAGTLAAALYLADPGGDRLAGWTYRMQRGVWPEALAEALSLVAITGLLGLLARPSPRRVGLTALAIGGALLAHPVALPLLLTALLALGLADATLGVVPRAAVPRAAAPRAAVDTPGRPRAARWGAVGVAVALGAPIAALWWLPFLGARADALAQGRAWGGSGTAFSLGGELARGALFDGSWGFAVLLGAGGVLRWAFAPRDGARFAVALLAGALLLLASGDWVDALGLSESGLASTVLFARFAGLAKPFAAVAGGAWAVAGIARLARSRAPLPALFLAGSLVAPFAHGAASEVGDRVVDRPLLRLSDRPGAAERAELVAWGRAHPVVAGQRWALLPGPATDAHRDLAAALEQPVWFPRRSCCTNFRNRPRGPTRDVVDGLGVRYLVGESAAPPTDDAREVARFGRLRVWERVPAAGTWLELGEPARRGAVSWDARGPGRVLLQVAATPDDAGQTLRLPLAAAEGWTAWRDGRPVSLGRAPWAGAELMTVPVAPGRTELRYVPPGAAGAPLAAGALLVVLALLLAPGGARRLAAGMGARSARARAAIRRTLVRLPGHPASWAFGLGGAALIVLGGRAVTAPAPLEGGSGAPPAVRFDARHALVAAHARILAPADRPCTRRGPRHLCPLGDDVAPLGELARPRSAAIEAGWGNLGRVDRRTLPCVMIPAQPAGPIELRWSGLPGGTRLVAEVALAEVARGRPSVGPRTVRVEIDGVPVAAHRLERVGELARLEGAARPSDGVAMRWIIGPAPVDAAPLCLRAQLLGGRAPSATPVSASLPLPAMRPEPAGSR